MKPTTLGAIGGILLIAALAFLARAMNGAAAWESLAGVLLGLVAVLSLVVAVAAGLTGKGAKG